MFDSFLGLNRPGALYFVDVTMSSNPIRILVVRLQDTGNHVDHEVGFFQVAQCDCFFDAMNEQRVNQNLKYRVVTKANSPLENGHHHVVVALSFLHAVCDVAIPMQHKCYCIDD